VLTVAKHHVDKAGQHAYRHRRTKKREFRALWIARINAAARNPWHNLFQVDILA